MALHIAFEKEADGILKRIIRAFAGPYIHVDLIVSQISPSSIHTCYSAYMGEGFSRVFQRDFPFTHKTHDFLFVDVSADELQKISETCEACADSRIQYNVKDMALCILPLRRPREKTLFESDSLFCSQAMILILRTCLNTEHPLQSILQSVNSRTTTPSQLHTALRAACLATDGPIE
jgi:hypothetical protein